jgi:hypothetical protein
MVLTQNGYYHSAKGRWIHLGVGHGWRQCEANSCNAAASRGVLHSRIKLLWKQAFLNKFIFF